MPWIYCLYSTSDGRPRYVGQTTKSPALRLAQHLRAADRRPETPLQHWMQTVTAEGFQVRVHPLQADVHPADLALFERYWIAQFADLLNRKRRLPLPSSPSAIASAVERALRSEVKTNRSSDLRGTF